MIREERRRKRPEGNYENVENRINEKRRDREIFVTHNDLEKDERRSKEEDKRKNDIERIT